ncbi:MAG: phosphatase PAP2 family protein [Ignavibacteria bacterium]|jgi:membrane-associated phospholipid phosphatase|nr:phosphatase PAP2 family protein [Ignavibacteria bacterium]
MKKICLFITIIVFTIQGFPQEIVQKDSLQVPLQQEEQNQTALHISPFDNIGNNFLNAFSGYKGLLQLAGIASTYALIHTDVDYHVTTYFMDHSSYANYALPAVVLGSTLPITTGGVLYFLGKHNNDNRMIGASFAVLQSGLLTVAYISVLKGITGRAHPDASSPADRKAVSSRFNFGLVRSGIYRGWPSGHVGGAMAVASALSNYYPEKTWLKYLTYGWVAYTMASVSAFHKGTMHWFSDAVAASMMTYTIGASVGTYYRNVMEHNNEDVKFRFLPIAGGDYSGIILSYSF